ncbi:MAG: hypothetical protein LBC74_09920 [Planctomycetaceae bacterium]|jgi:hypothetical protein|nr:hypothetical protein [Planctomycetaceae bacterium]
MIKKLFFVFVLFWFLSVGIFVMGQRPPVPTDPKMVEKTVETGETNKTITKKRIREGVTFQNKRVFFRQTGNRTTIYTIDGNDRYVCLENLNLERILKSIAERPEQGTWKIDGTFTEFNGENFVLISRAVVSPTDYSTKEQKTEPQKNQKIIPQETKKP